MVATGSLCYIGDENSCSLLYVLTAFNSVQASNPSVESLPTLQLPLVDYVEERKHWHYTVDDSGFIFCSAVTI